MSTSDHSLLSSYREALLEHLFAGEVMKHVWRAGGRRLEVLKPQVDDGGYDLVLENSSVVRPIQLKATFLGSTVRSFTINSALASKPSGCVVCLKFDKDSLDLGPFYWLGSEPGQPLKSLSDYPVAKHTKANSKGVKSPRPNMRTVPLSAFTKVPTIAELAERLFGTNRPRLAARYEVSVGCSSVPERGSCGYQAQQTQLRREPTAEELLTNRQIEILVLLAHGKSSKEIGFELGLSSKTVDVHRTRIMERLEIRDVASLTLYAVREGLVKL